MLLFICHASEDQADFVEPLAKVLNAEFDVWYAPYVLHLGDSLRAKIDEGLRSCDFGIVVLSEAFFAKVWPQSELDAMFTLETQSRKIILPIRKGLTVEQLARHSPLLAGRLSVSAAEGIPKVVDKIRLAVTVSDHQRRLTALAAASEKIRTLEQAAAQKQHSLAVLASALGADLLSKSFDELIDFLEQAFDVTASSTALKITVARPTGHIMYASTEAGMHLNVRLAHCAQNSAILTTLEAKVFRVHFDHWGMATEEPPTEFQNREYKPVVTLENSIIWNDAHGTGLYSTEALAAHLVEIFVKELEQQL